MKLEMVNWYRNDRYQLTPGSYSVTNSYNVSLAPGSKLNIAELVLLKLLQPRHRLIVWLATQNLSWSDLGAGVQCGCRSRGQILRDPNFKI